MSLTPQSRNQETTMEAVREGVVSGSVVLVSSVAALYVAMKNKTFMARTNWQSRTAMVIMPALFVFSLTAEKYVENRMKEIAEETKAAQGQSPLMNHSPSNVHELHMVLDQEQKLYSVVPGDRLELHHRIANYVAAHPIKTLVGVAAPSVLLIFYGRTGKEHLQMSMKLLHTRVFGQFATISLLLGIMGFKEYMNKNGIFITQVESEQRAEEMKHIREYWLERLEQENQLKQDEEQRLSSLHREIINEQKELKHKKHSKAASSMMAINDSDATPTASTH